MIGKKKSRCSSCRHKECEFERQRTPVYVTASAMAKMQLLDHRYTIEGPEQEPCCQISAYCPHEAIGYEPDTSISLKCLHCGGKTIADLSRISIPEMMLAIANHEMEHGEISTGGRSSKS